MMWAILIIAVLLLAAFIASKVSKPAKATPDEVAGGIEKFLSGTANPYYWDDFTSVALADKYLDDVRIACDMTRNVFPPTDPRAWSSDEGMEVLRKLAGDVREYGRTGKPPRDPRSLLTPAREQGPPGAGVKRLPDTFPYTARWDSVGLGCAFCAHFEGPEKWPDAGRMSRCALHHIPLTIQLNRSGTLEGEWFCRDFKDNGKAHAPAVQHLNEIRDSLQAGVLYELGRPDGKLGEHRFDELL